ncbi:FecR family protein [Leeuwenhoekiella sp. LLG6367-2.1]|uniref:FecR family protein n=1 Tax=Leeuwenhoekiella sp. LLG6367-2.1 TaxID=3160833 RepID=UPI00386E4543
MTRKELLELAKKHELGQASKAEELALLSFIEGAENASSTLKVPSTPINKKRILKAINAKIKPKQPRFTRRKIMAYAAIFVAIIGVGVLSNYLYNGRLTIESTSRGEKRTVLLADGSKIFLNSNSRISYPKNFKTNRTVALTGEAFFEVHRDPEHPFSITTGEIETQVLGTTFNINSYNQNEVLVTVSSGKVSVRNTRTQEAVYLQKNQQVLFKDSAAAVQSPVNSEDQIAWTKNIISLHDTSLAKTAAILENWYDVQIDFENKEIENLKITGKFKEESLENVFRSIALINNLTIDTLTQKHFVIRENSSN